MDENTPRHDNKIHFSGDIMKRVEQKPSPGEQLRSGEKTAEELLSELKLKWVTPLFYQLYLILER